MKETMAYCSVTYLFSFTREELGLPTDASDAELDAAAEKHMEKVLEQISAQSNICYNDLEISVA